MTERMGFPEAFVRLLAKTVANSQQPDVGKMRPKDAVRLAAIRGKWAEMHRKFEQYDRDRDEG